MPRFRSLCSRSCLAAGIVAASLAAPGVALAAPDDAVVFAPHPKAVAKEREDKIALTAEEDLGDRPLVIYGPVREREPATASRVAGPVWWLGLGVSPLLAPIRTSGRVTGQDSLTTNRFRACVYPHEGQTCGVVKGFDFKLQLFASGGTREYPRFIGYLRSGYSAGRVSVKPRANGSEPGDAMAIQYVSAPIFAGANAYAFKTIPVRPYAGMGVGVDLLRLTYDRFEAGDLVDISGRVGLEVHGGVEGRITNFVSLHAEVMQQFSARRRVAGLPDVSPTGLSVLLGVTAAIPLNLDTRR